MMILRDPIGFKVYNNFHVHTFFFLRGGEESTIKISETRNPKKSYFRNNDD